jgi:FkbM family methyltransferase
MVRTSPVVLEELPNGMQVHSLNRDETLFLYEEIFTDQAYLPDGGLTFDQPPVIIDGGANIGLFSLFCAQRWPQAQIHAFEAVPDIYEVLQLNLAPLFGAQAYNIGLSDRSELTEISYYPKATVMSGLHTDPARDAAVVKAQQLREAEANNPGGDHSTLAAELDVLLRFRFKRSTRPCTLDTLPAIIARLGLSRIDLLKLDIEGSEVAALSGLDAATWPMVRRAVIEVDDAAGELDRVLAMLAGNGMATAVVQPAALTDSKLFLVHARRED